MSTATKPMKTTANILVRRTETEATTTPTQALIWY